MHGEAVRYAAVFAFDVAEIARLTWRDVEAILLGKRQPKVMRWVARIVGYYSSLSAWNRSKLAELRDRHEGDYEVK
jgi:hypothetical protein